MNEEPKETIPFEPGITKRVLNAIHIETGISPDAQTGKTRPEDVANARQLGMYIFRRHVTINGGPLPQPAIGRIYGGRDHGTVLHGVRATENRLDVYPRHLESYVRVCRTLNLQPVRLLQTA